MEQNILILGVSGQDGSYLANHLLSCGHHVTGSTRDLDGTNFSRMSALNILGDVKLVELEPSSYESVYSAIKTINPAHIYNLSGESSVASSFHSPIKSTESICSPTLNILESIRQLNCEIRFFNAGSTDCFGSSFQQPASETTPFKPLSPYAVAKISAFQYVQIYRQAYGIKACTGLLGNHESSLRPTRFVTQKIIQGVKNIKAGLTSKLCLGNLNIWRDWGWAPDYVIAMSKMLNADKQKDYIIASGTSVQLKSFVQEAFINADLNYEEHLEINDNLVRPNDLLCSKVSPDLIKQDLNWSSNRSLSEIVFKMYNNELF